MKHFLLAFSLLVFIGNDGLSEVRTIRGDRIECYEDINTGDKELNERCQKINSYQNKKKNSAEKKKQSGEVQQSSQKRKPKSIEHLPKRKSGWRQRRPSDFNKQRGSMR